MARRKVWGLVLVAAAGSLLAAAWLYGRPPYRFMAGAKLQETTLMEYVEPLGAGRGYVAPKLTAREYTIEGNVHDVAGRAFADLVPKGWEWAPVPQRFHPFEPRFLEVEIPRLFTNYEFAPSDPALRERYAVQIFEWQGKTYVDVVSPTTDLDRIAHFLGRR